MTKAVAFPPQQVAFVGPETGVIDRDWLAHLQILERTHNSRLNLEADIATADQTLQANIDAVSAAAVTTFIGLTDAADYVGGDALKVVRVNAAGTGLDYGAVLGTMAAEPEANYYTTTEADAAFQPKDATLTSLAAYNTNGLLTQTAADTFTGRTLTAPAAGFTITNPAGIAGNPTFVLANDLAAIEGLGSTGIAVRSASDTWVQRTLIAPAAGITVTNGDGVSGNPTLVLANDLAALEGLASTGLAVRSAADTWLQRSIAAGTGITVTNGSGVSGNPTVAITGATEATVSTTDGSVTNLLVSACAASTTTYVRGSVIGRRTGGVAGTAEDGAAYEINAAFKNVAGAATIIGAATVTTIAEDQAAWVVVVNTNGANLRVRVTGAADNNVNWRFDGWIRTVA